MVPLFVELPYVIKAHLLSVQELNALAYVEFLGRIRRLFLRDRVVRPSYRQNCSSHVTSHVMIYV
jgi:hypothetical protein